MSIFRMDASPLWEAMGWTILHLVWVGAGIGLVAAIGRRLLRFATPEVRYGFALTCFLAFAAAPLSIFTVVFEPAHQESRPVLPSIPSSLKASTIATEPTATEEKPQKRTLFEVERFREHPHRPRLNSLMIYVARLWLLGATSTLSLLGTGLIGVERLRRSSQLIKSGLVDSRCRAMADSLGIARKIGVAISDRINTPILVGIIRPLILLPPSALTGWSVDQLEMALLHELAHLRRWDNLVNLAQRLIESFLFFHPVAWWLSGWIRLEREFCCDRLVVSRTGQAHAYAEMLVAMAGTGHGESRTALAMAGHQVVPRVRRIFNLEDRSMKLTMPEGFGLVTATIIGVALAFKAQAAFPPHQADAKEAVRKALRKSASDVDVALAKGPLDQALRILALVKIAQIQDQVDERAAAQATFQQALASIDIIDPNAINGEELGGLAEIAKIQREKGDLAGARATLDRLTRKAAFIKVDTSTPSQIDHPDETTSRVTQESRMLALGELLAVIALERIALEDLEEARKLCYDAIKAVDRETASLKCFMLSAFSSIMLKCGDRQEARAIIEQARQIASRLADPHDRRKGFAYAAQSLCEIGEVDEAIQLAKSLPDEPDQLAVLHSLLVAFTEVQANPWLDSGGYNIVIAAERLTLKDPSGARRALPKLAKTVRELLSPLNQARMLATIAHLQAEAGDITTALETIRSIPSLHRADFPGPGDGHYEAIKPSTLAMIAHLQARSGDAPGSRESYRQALILSNTITTDGERGVVQFVIAREMIKDGKNNEARTFIKEALQLAAKQTEPRRSRSLAMLMELQLQVGDVEGATQTSQAIRSYPGLEKLRALNHLADWYEKAGDSKTRQSFLRQAIECLQAKPPQKPALGPSRRLPLIIDARSSFDIDTEYEPKTVELFLASSSLTLRVQLGETEQALRLAHALPPEKRESALQSLAWTLAAQGDLAKALAITESLKSAETRMMTVCQVLGGFERRKPTK